MLGNDGAFKENLFNKNIYHSIIRTRLFNIQLVYIFYEEFGFDLSKTTFLNFIEFLNY